MAWAACCSTLSGIISSPQVDDVEDDAVITSKHIMSGRSTLLRIQIPVVLRDQTVDETGQLLRSLLESVVGV